LQLELVLANIMSEKIRYLFKIIIFGEQNLRRFFLYKEELCFEFFAALLHLVTTIFIYVPVQLHITIAGHKNAKALKR
jgi:hypothetical protein